jgi:hypothetical protein
MAATVPILTVKLIGEENLTVMNSSISWTPTDKTENKITLNSADGSKTIDYSVVSKVRTMVFFGTGNYKISITTQIGTDPTNTIIFESQDFFIFSPTPVMAATITAISLSTTSTTDILIEARVYGE